LLDHRLRRRRERDDRLRPPRSPPRVLHERRALRDRADQRPASLGARAGRSGGRRAMISLLVVNYRSAPLAIEAIRSARAAVSQPLQVVVVDNSDEADALRPHADVVVASPANRGYAGGINDGRAHCRGEIIVAANPDVIFGAGSIDALADALRH